MLFRINLLHTKQLNCQQKQVFFGGTAYEEFPLGSVARSTQRVGTPKDHPMSQFMKTGIEWLVQTKKNVLF
jgi:hypothetical protein